LLNLDNQKIKSEISFAGIEEVTEDPEDANVIWMKLKVESNRRKITCRDFTKQLFQSLQEGISRYKNENANDESNEKRDASEVIVDV